MKHDELIEMLKRYQEGNCSDRERAIVESWYNAYADQAEAPSPVDYDHFKRKHWNRITSKKNVSTVLLWAAAAAVTALSLFIYFISREERAPLASHYAKVEVKAGSDAATLKLSDGRILQLDSTALASRQDHGYSFSKDAHGSLRYHANGDMSKDILRNEIRIPKGGQFEITLPDGTHVWLNADTRMSYEMGGKLKERKISLEGEAYFEVAKNPKRPFRVIMNSQEVTVLGTHFNVSAYRDEQNVNTSLYEGSVSVRSSAGKVTLRPGQLARTSVGSGQVIVDKVEEAGGPSWVKGWISFEDESLASILKKASRWYNIEIEYKGNVPKDKFTGGISRKSNLAALLKVLESNGIKFRVVEKNGTKTLIVES